MNLTPKLNLPPIKARMRRIEGVPHIWDDLRGVWLVLTPEEWVRRHVIGWLVSVKRIPELSISQEYPVTINGMAQRADIVVMDERANPYILVECKAADVDIDEKVLDQARRYNAVVGARFVIITNGRKIFCYEHSQGLYRAVSSL